VTQPAPSRNTTRRVVRLGCVLLVGVVLAGHVGAVLHQSLVQHAVCSEHGEATHGDVVAKPGAAERVVAHASYDGIPASAADDDHEHCLLALTRRDAAVAARSHDTTLAPPQAAKLATVLETSPAHAPIATLRLAPKSSPPAIA